MPRVLRLGVLIASTLFVLAPAIWNHFPLLQYDTGGYFVRWFEGYLVPSRSTVFGLYLNILSYPDFWPAIGIQAALTVWLLALLLRAFGLSGRPLLLLGVTATLCLLTALPWLASMLLTDIFAGLAVLSMHLLVFAEGELLGWERKALVALIAFSVAVHSATFAVISILLAGAVAAWWLLRVGKFLGIARVMIGLVIGAMLLIATNYVVARKIAWTPGGLALSFGRMLQDGIVSRYLADHCPDEGLKLCKHRHELPADADVFFWSGDGSVFNKLGRFAALGGEMEKIVLGSLRDYPAWQIEAALSATLHQLTLIKTGEGVRTDIWHTYWAIERFAPSAALAMHAARQQHGEIGFASVNRIHQPMAFASMLLLFAAALFGWRHQKFSDLGMFAGLAASALFANAFVCGVLSNPHDRYGARLVWIAPLVVTMLLCRLYLQRGLSETASEVRSSWKPGPILRPEK